MISPKHYGIVMNFWMSLFNGIVVSTVMIYANTGAFPPAAILISSLEALAVAFVAGLIIPAAPFGAKLAEKTFHSSPGKFKYIVISNIPVCLMMAVVLSLTFALINVGFKPPFLMAWLGSVPLAFLASLLTSIVLTPAAVRICNAMTGVK
ncbi:hypothetical protein CAFE_34610 [Caprobacter fermentans]|uniref:DUF2798 domain-containing protein n=1 Tax=Caproicibacter fermentans TaxID=2576756 RepID=A0A6N8I432_9FIRM|nr:DUF2798 domain-containing protein [Caproicibacter fermentans]MVB12719.1 hypothetical protein [Caproicibacter fermentans]OCN02209.1 hypothetical protein A7X67_15625 [Clostridium sp. W14A]QNK39266.1 DUF2798 domain-containing protein [Caproicibacter fermentans]